MIEKLGDSLWRDYQLVEPAHFCYLVGDYCTSLDLSQRVSLIGSDHKNDKLHYINVQSIQRTEIYEYCKQQVKPSFIMPSLLCM